MIEMNFRMFMITLTLYILVERCNAFSHCSLNARQVGSNCIPRIHLRMVSDDDVSNGIVSIARQFVQTGFGVAEPSLLAEDFTCSGPASTFGKSGYLSRQTRELATFQRAVPDFDTRAYNYQIDAFDSNKVWFSLRPIGTVTGPLSYNGEVLLPNNKEVEFPVQQMSVTIQDNKVIKCTMGYVADRIVGNTGGIVGIPGLLYALGEKPNKFSYLPAAVVLKQFFGRTRKVLKCLYIKYDPPH